MGAKWCDKEAANKEKINQQFSFNFDIDVTYIIFGEITSSFRDSRSVNAFVAASNKENKVLLAIRCYFQEASELKISSKNEHFHFTQKILGLP